MFYGRNIIYTVECKLVKFYRTCLGVRKPRHVHVLLQKFATAALHITSQVKV
jgi:hypothetical protein